MWQAIPNLTAQLGFAHDNATGDEYANIQLEFRCQFTIAIKAMSQLPMLNTVVRHMTSSAYK